MTKPREKTREELQAEIEDGKKKIRQFENREKIIKQKLSVEERKARNHRLCKRGGFIRRTHLCISWNRTIISQTAKDHAKPRTSGTTPRIAERCNPYAQTADTSRIRQALIFPP